MGYEVYTMGMGPESTLVKRSLLSMIRHSNVDPDKIIFAQALPHINRLAKIGGALSRRYGFVTIGRYLAARGICQSYEEMASFVKQTKNSIKYQ